MARDVKQERLKRFDDLKKNKKSKVKTTEHVTYGMGGITEVRCKTCNAPIKVMKPVPEFEETKVIKGKTFIYQRLVLAETPQYSEIEIEMDDGSLHITPTCKDCIKHMDTDTLQDMYTADLSQHHIDEEKGLGAVLWEHMLDRKPVRLRRK